MSVLSDFEDRIASAVEGLFAGAFRSPVQPAEIAKALGRQMDTSRTVGVEKIYVPNLFTVALSPEDDERFGGFLDTLAGELSTYLVAYARERGYTIPGMPIVRFMVDPRLRLGRFDVFAELVSAEELGLLDVETFGTSAASDPEQQPISMHTFATVTVSDLLHDVALKDDCVVVGRLAECGICLEDANVSRNHAAFQFDGMGWTLVDLDSTNGTFVNGERITRVRLRDGDVIQVGATKLIFHEPRR